MIDYSPLWDTLKEKNLSITSKTVREERNVLKLESKAVRFVDFAKGKSWFLLLLSVGILIPSVVGITIYALATVTMLILANNKKFKQMDLINLNVLICHEKKLVKNALKLLVIRLIQHMKVLKL